MAFPRDSLRAFLAHAKSALATAIEQSEKVTLVIGNESADLDSLTSSLLYAYIRSLSPPPSAFTPLYIPLLQIPSSDLPLHPEHTALLHHAAIPPSALITLSDLPPAAHRAHALPPASTRWILVDHNALPPPLAALYAPRVHGVIDHHADEAAVPPATHPEPRLIQKCGSCTSLVVRYCRPAWDASSGAAHGRGGAVEAWDAQVARVAIASVLVDTGNLAAGGAAEDVDREAVEYLEGRIARVAGEAWDRGGFYEEMQRAKGELGGLALRDVWRKDYKAWREGGWWLGVSSVVKPLSWLLLRAGEGAEGRGRGRREAFDEAVDAFMRERGLVVYAIMTTYTTSDGRFQRELLLQARPEGAGAAERFVDKATPELGLEAWEAGSTHEEDLLEPVDESVYRRVWRQKEVGRSRKQVAPLLRAAMC